MDWRELEAWRKKAICRGGQYAINDFFDTFEKKEQMARKTFIGKTCEVCPSFDECREWAHENSPDSGLFAGEYWRNGRPHNPLTRAIKNIETRRDRRHSLTSAA